MRKRSVSFFEVFYLNSKFLINHKKALYLLSLNTLRKARKKDRERSGNFVINC